MNPPNPHPIQITPFQLGVWYSCTNVQDLPPPPPQNHQYPHYNPITNMVSLHHKPSSHLTNVVATPVQPQNQNNH